MYLPCRNLQSWPLSVTTVWNSKPFLSGNAELVFFKIPYQINLALFSFLRFYYFLVTDEAGHLIGVFEFTKCIVRDKYALVMSICTLL